MGEDLEDIVLGGRLRVPRAAAVVVRVQQHGPRGGLGLGAHVSDPSRQKRRQRRPPQIAFVLKL